MDSREVLLALDIYCEHDWNAVYTTILSKDISMFDDENALLRIETEKYAILAKGYKIVVLNDIEYPKKIFKTTKPPFVIYYKGSLDTVADRYSYKLPEEYPERMFVE